MDVEVSAREGEVLAAVVEHMSNAEIADRLFISVRTVESHVSSLLRKFQVTDRRALAGLAATRPRDSRPPPARPAIRHPQPLTAFVGRAAERAALVEALRTHRLVTTVGPGGVGKTRLVLSVLDEVAEWYSDGAWFVDLVPVSDPGRVAVAVRHALGLGEPQSGSTTDALIAWLADREVLLVLDNCEHLLDGVVVLLEQLLAACPRVRVLATSRARLLVPFERVFPVPGLSTEPAGGARGDAVTLFLDRAAAGGSPVAAEDEGRVAALCRALDGMALAIELAAARVPSLGLDGLEAGLADQLRLLAGGRRVDDRHRSLRSTLDWSYSMLDEPERAVLRRTAPLAAPFTVAVAGAVLDSWTPVHPADVPATLAALADRSLLMASVDEAGTRYRMLETVRQYGVERLAEAGEEDEARTRHVHWCLAAASLLDSAGQEPDDGRRAFDAVADDLRAALRWAAGTANVRAEAHALATLLADLCFRRGWLEESQRRYEQAAELAPDDATAAESLRGAEGAAAARHFGNEALRLGRAAADAALRAGDRAGAAVDLARSAELINRGPGLLATLPPADAVFALLAEARSLAVGDPRAEARTLVAEAYNGAELDPLTAELTERAIVLARRVNDPLIESAALDQLTAIQLARGEHAAAAASTRRRAELLRPLPIGAANALEFFDAYGMASDCAISAGDLRSAHGFAECLRDLPFYREEGHLAGARLLQVTAIAGQWDETVRLAHWFREGWECAGLPRAGNLSRGAYAAAAVYGLRGDEASRATWLGIVAALATPGRPLATRRVGQVFDAWVLLHRGQVEDALRLLDTPPEQARSWWDSLWRPWYAAMWAEAAVLGERADAGDRIAQARLLTAGNPIAEAIVDRAAGLRDPASLVRVAAALDAAGCRYQWARTLVFLGGEHRNRAEAALAAMGATPMAGPPG